MYNETVEEVSPDFTRVETGRSFPTVRLVEPSASGYLQLAAEVDRRPMFLPNSRRKRRLLRELKRLATELAADSRVIDVAAFEGGLAPPGRGEVLEARPDVPVARFDVAVIVETTSPETAAELESGETYTSGCAASWTAMPERRIGCVRRTCGASARSIIGVMASS